MIPLLLQPLTGLHVLVTRPAAQSEVLSNDLQAAGAQVTRWPALQIVPLNYALPETRYDLLIFVSANAVQHGQNLLTQQPQARLAAVGPTTAAALHTLGQRVDAVPEQGADSEALLAHPLLQPPPPHILLVRGQGGRELLRDELRARGSQVTVLETYTRQMTQPDAAAVHALQQALQDELIDIVTATSVDVLHALHTQLGDCLLQPGLTLLAGSARIAQAALDMGWPGEYVLARSPQDRDLLTALSLWHARQRNLKLVR